MNKGLGFARVYESVDRRVYIHEGLKRRVYSLNLRVYKGL